MPCPRGSVSHLRRARQTHEWVVLGISSVNLRPTPARGKTTLRRAAIWLLARSWPATAALVVLGSRHQPPRVGTGTVRRISNELGWAASIGWNASRFGVSE